MSFKPLLQSLFKHVYHLTIKCLFILKTASLFADNQTDTLSPVLPSSNLPFEISIDLMDLSLPNGWHSGAVGLWGSKALFLAGRTNGLHGFDNAPNSNNFPPSAQNTTLYVVDFKTQKVWQRSLKDCSSGLTQSQIDLLSVTSPQSYQSGSTLYMTGGYGIDSATGQMDTKAALSAINVPKLIKWVTNPGKRKKASSYIRHTFHPLVQVTGGYMNQASPHDPVLLIFGQNFTGLYRTGSNGAYTHQIRTFRIFDNGKALYVAPMTLEQKEHPAYRRRDLNVAPIMHPATPSPIPAFVALSGVFTQTGGIWTVPVMISSDGQSYMADPQSPDTFKQAMNNYASASVGLFSNSTKDMYIVLLGGITFGYFENGTFNTDSEIPFTNEVTSIKIDKQGIFSQYLMQNQYPTIPSTFSNPGNTLLFGAGAEFIAVDELPSFSNAVLALDPLLKKPQVIGYIVGGIQSTLPNTNSRADSAASPYIFQVSLIPK